MEKDLKAKDFIYIAENLKAIRDELKKEHDELNKDKRKNPYSLTNFSKKIGVTRHTVTNVERGTFGTATIIIILFYYNLGYNIEWMFVKDNEFIPKKNIGENLVYQKDVQNNFKALETDVSKNVNNIITLLSQFKDSI